MAAKYKKRADGRYCTHVVIGAKPDGGPQRKTIYAKTIRELEEKAAELRRQVGKGTVVQGGSISVNDWGQEWLSAYKSGVSGKTYSMYKSTLTAHIIPSIGRMRLKDVRPFHLQQLITSMQGKKLTRTINHTVLTLKQMFKRAVENNLLERNPVDLIDAPKRHKPTKRALTAEERASFEAAPLPPIERAFLLMLMYTGLRRGEVLALTWSDINMQAKTVSVSKTWSSDGNKAWIKPSPKSAAGNRDVPMPESLYDTIEALRSTATSDFLFPSSKGTLMSETVYRRFWVRIADALNTSLGGTSAQRVLRSDVTPHIFRHTYATMLFYAGIDIKTAQYLLGHSSITMTLDIYTHLDKGKVSEAAVKLNNFVSSSQNIVDEPQNTDIY